MQTFLPYPDFAASAKCLDSRRLGKQRVKRFSTVSINGMFLITYLTFGLFNKGERNATRRNY